MDLYNFKRRSEILISGENISRRSGGEELFENGSGKPNPEAQHIKALAGALKIHA